MRWNRVVILAPAIALAVVTGMGEGVRGATDPAMPLIGADSLDQEPMSGPDAWEAFGMGRVGLVVPYGRDGAVTAARARELRRAALEDRLGLSPAQRERLAAVRAAARRVATVRDEAIRLARVALDELLRDDVIDRPRIDRATDRVARIEADALRARVALALDERAVLTPAQRRMLRDELAR